VPASARTRTGDLGLRRGRRWAGSESDPVLAGLPLVAELAGRRSTRAGQPFLVRSDGLYQAEMNAFLGSARMRGVAEGTRRKYAFELSIWLGFLDATDCCWSNATPDDVDAFKFWRMSDELNPRRVAGGTVRSGLVAISSFYEWAENRCQVKNPGFAGVGACRPARAVSGRVSGSAASRA
jgi:Phage integrase, N-terminal SAM-like domain